MEGVEEVSEVIEDNAYVRYNRNEMVAVIKGVSDSFLKKEAVKHAIVQGELKFYDDLDTRNIDYAIIGRGIQYILNIAPNNDFYALQIFYPIDIKRAGTNPEKMLNRDTIMISALFALENHYT